MGVVVLFYVLSIEAFIVVEIPNLLSGIEKVVFINGTYITIFEFKYSFILDLPNVFSIIFNEMAIFREYLENLSNFLKRSTAGLK